MLTEYQVHHFGGQSRLRESEDRSTEKVEIYSLSLILNADHSCVFLLICNLSKPKHPHKRRPGANHRVVRAELVMLSES